MKTTNIKSRRNTMMKIVFVFLGLIAFNVLFAQGAHPGTDPIGMPVPIDGGILMAILAGGGLVTMLFKKKKKDDK